MSPEMIVWNNSEIDLSGSAGQQQGEEGKVAGTQYSLFKQISTTNDGSEPSRITIPNVAGGQGANGRNGSTGITGANATPISINIGGNSYDCAAWFGCIGCPGGMIQIRRFNGRNTCNSCTTDYRPSNGNCYCWAGNLGVQIRITGESGYTGSNGGKGENGSCGGGGGQSYYVDANFMQSPKIATNGTQGVNGVGGTGGQGGLGGLYGDDMILVIYEGGRGTIGNRWCIEGSRTLVPNHTRATRGSTGAVGASCTSQKPMKLVDKTKVTNSFASFKADMVSSNDNEFLFAHATSFLDLIGDAQPFDVLGKPKKSIQ